MNLVKISLFRFRCVIVITVRIQDQEANKIEKRNKDNIM